MMCKFLPLPSQDPRHGLVYVAGSIDAKGVAHDQVTLVRGVPEDFLQVACGLTTKERYKSFIASWSPGDAPNPEQMERVIGSLERLLFGDLDPSRFSYVVYVHRKGDKVDLHALVANVELTSGKSFNAAPPRWQGSFDAWRDMHNFREGWASPADPRLARKVQPGPQTKFKGARTRQGKSTLSSHRAELNAYALDLVDSGLIASREALIEVLGHHGHVNRVNPDFISVIPPELGKPVRLKGAIFEEGFDFAAAVKRGPMPAPVLRPSRTAKDHDADRDPVAEAKATRRFEAAVARRNTHNSQRFTPRRKRAFARTREADQKPHHQDVPKEESAPAAPMDLTIHDAPIDLDIGKHQAAEAIASAAGRIAPQLLRAIPTHISNETSHNTSTTTTTREDEHERPDRSATSRGIAALVRDLRERFEQLAQRVVEFGGNIRRKRWLHAGRFDVDGRAHPSAGVPPPGADAATDQEATAVTKPVVRPGRAP